MENEKRRTGKPFQSLSVFIPSEFFDSFEKFKKIVKVYPMDKSDATKVKSEHALRSLHARRALLIYTKVILDHQEVEKYCIDKNISIEALLLQLLEEVLPIK